MTHTASVSVKKIMPAVGPKLIGALILGFFLTVLSTTIFSWWAWDEIKIQPVMVIIVWCGFKLPFVAGGIVVMLLGYLWDSLSGGIVGLQVIANVVVFCLCAIAQRHLALNNWLYQILAVGIMNIISPLIVIGGLVLVSHVYIMPDNIIPLLLWQAPLSALIAPLFFVFLEGLVRVLQKIWPTPGHGNGKH